MGYSADPFSSYLALLFIACGNMFLADIFSLIGKKRSYLVSAMILSSTTISVLLSYRFTSSNFGLAYLLSISAVWVLYKLKNRWVGMIVSSVMICLSLGAYQADLGCTSLLILLVILFMCLGQASEKDIFEFFIRCAVSVTVACLVYKLIWDLSLSFFRLEPNSYNGASNVSVSLILKKMPVRILATYTQFFKYFFGNSIKHSIFQQYKFYVIVFMAFGGVLLWKGFSLAKKKSWIRLAIYLSGIILIPVACNVSMILAPESGFLIQQSVAMAILFPSMLCLVGKLFNDQGRLDAQIKYFTIGLSLFILYGNIYMTATDLETMYEGNVSSDAIIDQVVHTLIGSELYSEEKEYVFLGRISDSPMFRKTVFWDRANSYARYGEFWTGANVMSKAYYGLLRRGGVNLKIAGEEGYELCIRNEKVANMPCYPSGGSIQDIDGYIVVKISDKY